MSDHIYIDATTRLKVNEYSGARQLNVGGKTFLELCPVEVESQTLAVNKKRRVILLNPDQIMAIVIDADSDVIPE